jgi:hypothetical protein
MPWPAWRSLPDFRPRARQRAQRVLVDLGIQRRRQLAPAAENQADLGQRRADAQHLGRQRVPEPVRAPALQPRPVAGAAYDRQDATAGTAPASETAVRPVACANRRNARSDVTIAFADQVLRPLAWSTINGMTLPASSPLSAPRPPIAARNAFACLE